jgi:hypothetical protein
MQAQDHLPHRVDRAPGQKSGSMLADAPSGGPPSSLHFQNPLHPSIVVVPASVSTLRGPEGPRVTACYRHGSRMMGR